MIIACRGRTFGKWLDYMRSLVLGPHNGILVASRKATSEAHARTHMHMQKPYTITGFSQKEKHCHEDPHTLIGTVSYNKQ